MSEAACSQQPLETSALFERKLNSFTQEELEQWLASLTDDDVIKFHGVRYYPIYLNLLSVFCDKMSADEVRSLAVECTRASIWSHRASHNCISRLPDLWRAERCNGLQDSVEASMRIKGFDLRRLQSLLDLGSGLIVCSFRFGLYSLIPIELALLGMEVSLPLQEGKFRNIRDAIASALALMEPDELDSDATIQGRPAAANIRLLKLMNAEDSSAPFRIVRALKKGALVFLYPDGNSGIDGPWGDQSRIDVSFLGFTVRVKNGAARLAYRMGSPLLPVLALAEPGREGRMIYGEPIIPSVRSGGYDEERFEADATQSLYSFLETNILSHPEQWEGCSALHRWRRSTQTPVASANQSAMGEKDAVPDLLQRGKAFMLNERGGIAKLPAADGEMWVDVRTLKSFKCPSWARGVLDRLSSPPGLDQRWIAEQNGSADWRARVESILEQLYRLELVALL